MVNLSQAWAEKYQTEKSEITIEISGGGSGVGISSLTQGLADMANASRKMKDKEIRRAANFFVFHLSTSICHVSKALN